MAGNMSEFAKSHMRQTGWVEGKGLGRNEDGMSEAIKVKIKADNAGIGHDPGEQFTFHWWEHAFTRSAQNIKVTEADDGVKVETQSETEIASTRKRNRKLMKKKLLYGSFVKSGTLENGKVQKDDENTSSSESSESENENKKEPKILNDEELLAACGGRTAHKGARHGVNLGGKLARLQEQEMLQSGSSKTKNRKKNKKFENEGNIQLNNVEQNNDKVVKNRQKKLKKKKRKTIENDSSVVTNGRTTDSSTDCKIGTEGNIQLNNVEQSNDDIVKNVQKKLKKKKRKTIGNDSSVVTNGKTTDNISDCSKEHNIQTDCDSCLELSQTNSVTKAKRKMKKSKKLKTENMQ